MLPQLIHLLTGGLLFVSLGFRHETLPGEDPQRSGLYLTVADFRQHKLTLPADCADEKSAVRLNEFLNRSYITVLYRGKKYTYQKDSLFGLRECEGKDVRIYHRQLFTIEEIKAITIYRQTATEAGNGRGIRTMQRFYFSAGLDTGIVPLTKSNLKNAFPNNEKFHDLLDAQFNKDNEDVGVYDAFRHIYKVNRLLQASM